MGFTKEEAAEAIRKLYEGSERGELLLDLYRLDEKVLETQIATAADDPVTIVACVKGLAQQGAPAPQAGSQFPWWHSKLLADELGLETPWDQLTVYASCGAGAGGFVHYWRKANALMQAKEAIMHDPAKAEELKAIWMFTEQHMKKAAYHAARFRRTGVAAAIGLPLLFWARAQRANSQHGDLVGQAR